MSVAKCRRVTLATWLIGNDNNGFKIIKERSYKVRFYLKIKENFDDQCLTGNVLHFHQWELANFLFKIH
jgi:hypothetical protein